MGKLKKDLIPGQFKGSKMDAVEKRKLDSAEAAKELFKVASQRLLAVNCWGEYAGLSAFKLFNAGGDYVTRPAKKDDYIRIDIPGPGPIAGGGFDWVHVEDLVTQEEEEAQSIAMKVRPCANPLISETDVAHFLKPDATSTFLIRRKQLVVTAEEHGRNEMPNVATGNILDSGRNLIVGLAAKAGLAYPQWKILMKGLLDGKV